MLSGTLGASLLRNLLTGKGAIKAGNCTIIASEDTIRAGQDFWCRLYYLIFDGIYSGNNSK